MKFGGSALKTFFVVALAVGAIVFAALNMRDRMRMPPIPDDGVVWVNGTEGVTALEVGVAVAVGRCGERRCGQRERQHELLLHGSPKNDQVPREAAAAP